MVRTVDGPNGVFTADQVKAALRDPNSRNAPRSRLVSVENTSNGGFGTVWPLATMQGVSKVAHDAGLAMHLSGEDEPTGCHLENLVLSDLLAWRDTRLDRPEVLYWRTATGDEVDFVIDVGGRLLPIEVKASKRPRIGETKALRTFRDEYGRRCRAGLVLHTGDQIEWLAPGILSAPWWKVL